MGVQADEVGDEIVEMLGPSFRPSCLDGDVLTFDVAVVAQTEAECVEEVPIRRICSRPEEADPPHLVGQLGLASERREENTDAEAPDESAAISSAMRRGTWSRLPSA